MTFKNHACCGHTFAAIDGALALQARMEVAARDIERVRVGSYRAALEVAGYEIAAHAGGGALLAQVRGRDRAHARQRAPRRLRAGAHERPGARATLMARIEVAIDPELDAAFPTQRAARVAIDTRDGRRGGVPAAHAHRRPGRAAVGCAAGGEVSRARGAGDRRRRSAQALLAQAVDAGSREVPGAMTSRRRCSRRARSRWSAPPATRRRTPRARSAILRKHGYAGKHRPDQSATRSEVLGERCLQNRCTKYTEHDRPRLHHGAGDVEAALEDCGKRGVPVATIFSDGFADAGAEGAARQARLVARARGARRAAARARTAWA